MKLISGRSNLKLSLLISTHLDIPLTKCKLGNFSDGESSVNIEESVRGEHCYVVQSTCTPVNDNLMELIFIIDALKRADAQEITAIIPYFGYSRQDRKARPRQPISAKTVANMLSVAGATRVMTMDLHAGHIEGFFDIPLVHLFSKPIFLDNMLKNYGDQDLVFLSPDAGSMSRVANLVKGLKFPVAMIDKRRAGPNKIKSVNLIGDVKDKTVIIFDDIIDTGGTLLKSAELIIEKGAKDVIGYITHGIFSGAARSDILGPKSPFSKIYVSNTIPFVGESDKVCVIDTSFLIAKTIKRIQNKESVTSLFE